MLISILKNYTKKNITDEMKMINVDSSGIEIMSCKANYFVIKINELVNISANILKSTFRKNSLIFFPILISDILVIIKIDIMIKTDNIVIAPALLKSLNNPLNIEAPTIPPLVLINISSKISLYFRLLENIPRSEKKSRKKPQPNLEGRSLICFKKKLAPHTIRKKGIINLPMPNIYDKKSLTL